jgi:hypothetical protein
MKQVLLHLIFMKGHRKMKNNDVKLYHVTSSDCILPYEGKDYDGVTIKWFVYDRKKPVIPYEIGIQDYVEEPSDDEELLYEEDEIDLSSEENGIGKTYAQEALDELFTREEADMLQKYLIKKGMKCEIEERELPLSSITCGYLGFYDAAGVSMEGIVEIYSEPEYNLPFKVKGFYSMDSSPSWKTCVFGSYFMKAFLEKMQISYDKERLMDILKELYDEGWKIDISFPNEVLVHETIFTTLTVTFNKPNESMI